MQNFLRFLDKVDVAGKAAFAFDTRRDFSLARSAAKFIEERLRELGLKIICTRASAIIFDPEPENKRRESEEKDFWKERRHARERLEGGEEKRFTEIGAKIGIALAANNEEKNRARQQLQKFQCSRSRSARRRELYWLSVW
jgi:hypothetical protein